MWTVSYTHLDVYKRQPVACVEEENTCEKIHDCATILVWQKMNEAINDVVDHMTLQDLVDYEMKECSDYVI